MEKSIVKFKKHVKHSPGDKVYYAISYIIVILLLLVVVYPLIFIVSASLSSASAVSTGRVFLWPVEFSTLSYEAVFAYKDVFIGYKNSIIYTLAGTLINIIVTMSCAYPLSRKTFQGRKFFMKIFSFTMIFSGGMIPSYLNISRLGMIDSIWAMLLPGAMSVYNMIIARTFIQNSIPTELLEAAQIDGCSDTAYFFKVVLPLSTAVISVIGLYYAVGHWNSYFSAFLYLHSKDKFPLQIFLREVLVQNQFDASMIFEDAENVVQRQGLQELIKYSMIVVSTLPLLILYPFVQKFLKKGVMIGSIKG
ncbi:MAG: carbohydrate ABC transporter permease [Sphaerochaetaceae bacterium]|jgi:putative aldouronate transport system permease protein|nr:carbohydrate ABC transporter permease [Sphaerochaetaceae bacterium]